MHLSGALIVILTLGAGSGDDRVLVCRPEVSGDPARARAEAIAQAAAKIRGKFLEYGAECKDAGEGARAARRAGLDHAVVSKVEGAAEAARYEIVLADADGDAVRARRSLVVAPDADAVPPVKGALKDLLKTLPPKPGADPQHVAAWTVAGVGVAAVIAGVVLSSQAEGSRRKADRAVDPLAYTRERKRAKDQQVQANVAMGVGAAAVAGGLTWRFAF